MNASAPGDAPRLRALADSQCPGCGGRNLEAATVCDWCGRSVVEDDRARPVARGLMIAVVVILVVLAALAIQYVLTLGGAALGNLAP